MIYVSFACWLACFYGLQVHGSFASQRPFAIFIQPNHNCIFTLFCYFTEVAALAASSGRAHLFNRVSARVHNLAVLIQYVKQNIPIYTFIRFNKKSISRNSEWNGPGIDVLLALLWREVIVLSCNSDEPHEIPVRCSTLACKCADLFLRQRVRCLGTILILGARSGC